MSKIVKRGEAWHFISGSGATRIRLSLKTGNKKIAEIRENKLNLMMSYGTHGIKTQVAAQRYLEHIIVNYDVSSDTEFIANGYNKLSMKKIANEYRALCNDTKSSAWSRRIGHHLNRILNYFGDVLMPDIKPPDINNMIKQRTRDGFAPSTMNDEIAILNSLYKYAVGCQYIMYNPVDTPAIIRPKNVWVNPRSAPTHEIMQSIFRAGEKEGLYEDVIFWKLICYTGLRPGDAGNLTKDKIINEGTVQKKTGFRAALFLHPEIEQYGDAIYNLKPKEKPHRAKSRGHLQRIAKSLKWDKHIDLHCLRHYFATRMSELGLSAEDLKILTGHTSSKMVTNYAHPRYDYIKSVIKELN
jgi:integrase